MLSATSRPNGAGLTTHHEATLCGVTHSSEQRACLPPSHATAPHRFFDSGTYAPEVDTHLELVLPALRAANPETVVQVRDGGIWRDFIEVGPGRAVHAS